MPEASPRVDLIDCLARRARSDGARPLLTWYDAGSGARTELSGASCLNWVAKIANRLAEEDLAPGEAVALPVLAERPRHWLPPLLLLGCWARGLAADARRAASAEVAFLGPADPARVAPVTIACSLHPLGLAFGRPLPAGVEDAAELRSQPDVLDRVPWPTAGPALVLDDASHDFAALAGVAPSDARIQLSAGQPWPGPLAAALAGGGSLVLVDGDPAPEVALEIAAAEHATAD